MGAFAETQASYAAAGVATFPVVVTPDGDKIPAIKGWQRVGLRGSAKLAEKFADADALGFCPGAHSRLTVLDVDSSDERELHDAFARHGHSPVVVQSGRGHFQAWFRHNGEGRKIRPWPDKPVDVLGAGFVVAPPSLAPRGRYTLLQGGLSDLDRLPVLRGLGGVVLQEGDRAAEGRRNVALFRHCMKAAHRCADLDELLALARAEAATHIPPMDAAEVVKTARSAWGYTSKGVNRFGLGKVVLTEHAEIDRLAASDPDAFAMLAILRRHHWGRSAFPVANAFADSLGWTLPRFRAARSRLVTCGALACLHPGGRGKGDPPRFSFCA